MLREPIPNRVIYENIVPICPRGMVVWYNRESEVGQTIAGRASVMRKVRAPQGRRQANGLAG